MGFSRTSPISAPLNGRSGRDQVVEDRLGVEQQAPDEDGFDGRGSHKAR